MITKQEVETWITKYIHAWSTANPKDIKALFTKEAEYHEWPYETSWIGRDRIVKGWLDRQKWQEGGWTFQWSILTINGDTAAIEGTGIYKELGTFANLWVVTLNASGECSMFRMWNNEVRP